MSQLEQEIERIAEPVAERVARKVLAETPRNSVGEVDAETQQLISQHALISKKTYLTRKEAAVYLSVSERSVAEWSARPADQNPFPEENAGSEPRYKRALIDAWTQREGQRQRLKLAS
jgi:DNA-binding transcriptional regulator YiaG